MLDLEGRILDEFEACRPHGHEFAAPWRNAGTSGAAQRAAAGRGAA